MCADDTQLARQERCRAVEKPLLLLLAPSSMAVLTTFAACFGCPLPVIGEIAARRLATFMTSA